ncbi:hypothetical protein BPLS_P4386 [Bathymodiolus platifrons methanotrophic gill symbiont]|nr:hypothetical protein BPLS_P4386 [Bathymodiolus platifrons methanotrophic gill symbiont]
MAFYFVSTFANAQTPTKQRPYGYRGLKIITSLRLRFPDFQRMKCATQTGISGDSLKIAGIKYNINALAILTIMVNKNQRIDALATGLFLCLIHCHRPMMNPSPMVQYRVRNKKYG